MWTTKDGTETTPTQSWPRSSWFVHRLEPKPGWGWSPLVTTTLSFSCLHSARRHAAGCRLVAARPPELRRCHGITQVAQWLKLRARGDAGPQQVTVRAWQPGDKPSTGLPWARSPPTKPLIIQLVLFEERANAWNVPRLAQPSLYKTSTLEHIHWLIQGQHHWECPHEPGWWRQPEKIALLHRRIQQQRWAINAMALQRERERESERERERGRGRARGRERLQRPLS